MTKSAILSIVFIFIQLIFLQQTCLAQEELTNIPQTMVSVPTQSNLEAEFMDCRGNPETGIVSIKFKVKYRLNDTTGFFGGFASGSNETIAFMDKKTYKPYSSGEKVYFLPKDTWTEILLDGRKFGFEKVPAGLSAFEWVKVYYYIGVKDRGVIEFKNVSIQWDKNNAKN